MLNIFYDNLSHKLNEMDQNWLTTDKTEEYAIAMLSIGATFFWIVLNGIVQTIWVPRESQSLVYNSP